MFDESLVGHHPSRQPSRRFLGIIQVRAELRARGSICMREGGGMDSCGDYVGVDVIRRVDVMFLFFLGGEGYYPPYN